MPNRSRTPKQNAVLTEGARIAKIIAERAPRIDYTPAMLAEARGFYTPEDIAAVEERYGEFETFFVLTSFIQDYGIDKFASSLTQTLLYRNARRLDKQAFRANPYLAEVKIPTATDGRFTLTESRYARGELFQYDIPDFRAEYTVPMLGFFSQPVRFPTICEGGVPWMSVCPSEIFSMQAPIGEADGAVLVLGLGLGYYPFMISRKENVRRITIVERAPEVIRLFRTHLLPQFPHRDKIEIVEADAFDFLASDEARAFDFCFADLWQGAGDGAPLYARLKDCEARFPAMRFSYWIEDALKFFREG
jgi:Spermidine synthase